MFVNAVDASARRRAIAVWADMTLRIGDVYAELFAQHRRLVGERFQAGRPARLGASAVSLRAEVRSAADQIVDTLPTPDPARLASCVALPASPEPPPVVRVDEAGPHRSRFGEPHASDERERREDNADQAQLAPGFQQGHGP